MRARINRNLSILITPLVQMEKVQLFVEPLFWLLYPVLDLYTSYCDREQEYLSDREIDKSVNVFSLSVSEQLKRLSVNRSS